MQESNTTPTSSSNNYTMIGAGRQVTGLNGSSNITRLEDLNPEYVERLFARFCAEVKETEDPDECWEWQGSTDVDGYGRLSVQSKLYKAHRLSYLLAYGELDEALQVHHKVCDNPSCVNARHLSQGTPKENTADAIAKGRHHVFGKRCAVVGAA